MIAALRMALVGATLLATPLTASDFKDMTAEQRADFGAQVRAYLLENPQVIAEAITILQRQQEQAAVQAESSLIAQNYDAIFNDGFSWVGGNPDGDVTIVEFMDYRCGYCRKVQAEVAALLKQDPNVRLIIKEFPILGPQSELASRFAIAVRGLYGAETYGPVHNTLMAFKGDISDTSLSQMAQGFGLDYTQIKEKMTAPAVNNELAQTRALAQALQISGTPTFVLPDRFIRGYAPGPDMAAMVNEVRKTQ